MFDRCSLDRVFDGNQVHLKSHRRVYVGISTLFARVILIWFRVVCRWHSFLGVTWTKPNPHQDNSPLPCNTSTLIFLVNHWIKDSHKIYGLLKDYWMHSKTPAEGWDLGGVSPSPFGMRFGVGAVPFPKKFLISKNYHFQPITKCRQCMWSTSAWYGKIFFYSFR